LCRSGNGSARDDPFRNARLRAPGGGFAIIFSRVLVDPKFRDSFKAATARTLIHDLLIQRFKRYREAGQLDPAVKLESAVEILMGQTYQLGFIYPQILNWKQADLEQLAEEFAKIFRRFYQLS
jgi:hypothetical protein